MKILIKIFSNTFLLAGMYFLQQIRIELAVILLGLFMMFQKEEEIINILGAIIAIAMVIMLLYSEFGGFGLLLCLLAFSFLGFIMALEKESRKPTKF